MADASAVVAHLLVGRVLGGDVDLHSPALCDLEVVSAVSRAMRAGRLAEARGAEALDDYLALPLELHGHRRLLPHVLRHRDNFSAYDASYVALAEQLGAPLLTVDRALARAARAHTSVEVVEP